MLPFLQHILHIVKDVVKHHFIHLSCHPSVHLSDYPFVSPWSVYFDRAEKDWNTNTARQRIIYISVVKNIYLFFFILGFLDLGTLILSLSQQLKELGWASLFSFCFEILFRILEIFNAYAIAMGLLALRSPLLSLGRLPVHFTLP
jgi:hypothetical protein